MIADAIPLSQMRPRVVTAASPAVASMSASATAPTIPTWTTASTSMNSPTKKKSVAHSTSWSTSSTSDRASSIRAAAPSKAIVAGLQTERLCEQETDDRGTDDSETRRAAIAGRSGPRVHREPGHYRESRHRHRDHVRRTSTSVAKYAANTSTAARCHVDQEVVEPEVGSGADEDVWRDRRSVSRHHRCWRPGSR